LRASRRPHSGALASVGRPLFAAATLAYGVIALVWPGGTWMLLAAAAQIAGGAAMPFRRSARLGALLAGAAYLAFTVMRIPAVVATPRTYDAWGNVFEQAAHVTGALLVYASVSPARTRARLVRAGRVLFGLCALSFALEQAFYLKPTAGLVPAWIPPGQMFWAVATTIAFALAGLALLANRAATLAARLTTVMLLIFGFVVWLPHVVTNPRSHFTWSETIETFAIAGVAWLLAELLAASRRSP